MTICTYFNPPLVVFGKNEPRSARKLTRLTRLDSTELSTGTCRHSAGDLIYSTDETTVCLLTLFWEIKTNFLQKAARKLESVDQGPDSWCGFSFTGRAGLRCKSQNHSPDFGEERAHLV